MRKYANFIVKSVAVLLLGSAVALVAVIGLFFWRYEYEIGLPDPGKLAMVSAAELAKQQPLLLRQVPETR
jgi:hypothetical protein